MPINLTSYIKWTNCLKNTSCQLTQKETENWNYSIPIYKIDFAIQNLPTKKMLATDSFWGKFYQIHKEEIINILYKLFHKGEEEESVVNSFYETIYP